ncbi:lysophospholipid acyltransferase family protein [Streptomyces aureoversilis]|uniref:Lysophospholipid acyltransferase family protein n=1 Tax=Streptomyces aureoversilis TaxID=67277 RepID=A0ABW0A4H6_9ACTN
MTTTSPSGSLRTERLRRGPATRAARRARGGAYERPGTGRGHRRGLARPWPPRAETGRATGPSLSNTAAGPRDGGARHRAAHGALHRRPVGDPAGAHGRRRFRVRAWGGPSVRSVSASGPAGTPAGRDPRAPLAPRTPRRAVLAAWLRRALWLVALTLTGGVSRRGRLPRGGCVVVANHSSHADTAALLAALDARHAPLIGAAADYWFARPGRRRVCRWLAAGFPVRRTGGGLGDLLGTAGELRAGRAVVLFPEGTRGKDGGLGGFHRGALLLAEEAGVPVVPVGLAGTDRLLPKHGRLRPALVRVRIGGPLHGPVSPERARAAVAELAGEASAHPERDSALRRRTAAVVASRRGLPLAFAWAFAEALSWPLMPELFLAVACAAAPRAALRLSFAALAGTLVGGLLALQVAASGVRLPAPLTTPRMHAEAVRELSGEGAAAVAHQPWNGVPFKVYAAAAGRAHVAPGDFAVEAGAARSVRTVGVGLAFAALGALGRRLRQLYGLYLVLLGGGFAAGLSLIVAGWG